MPDASSLVLPKQATNEVLFAARHLNELASVLKYEGDQSLEKAAAQLNLSLFDLRRLVEAILNLQRLQERFGLTADQLLNAIKPSLERNCPATERDEAIRLWEHARPVIAEAVQIIGHHPLAVLAKAEQLAYVRERLFTQARVITELRPVFDEAGTKILRSVVSHELIIDYYHGQTPERIQIALDASDVIHLRRACERAERKSATIKADLRAMPWPTSVLAEPGEPPAS